MYTMDIRNMTGVPGNISDLSRKHSDGPIVSPMNQLSLVLANSIHSPLSSLLTEKYFNYQDKIDLTLNLEVMLKTLLFTSLCIQVSKQFIGLGPNVYTLYNYAHPVVFAIMPTTNNSKNITKLVVLNGSSSI